MPDLCTLGVARARVRGTQVVHADGKRVGNSDAKDEAQGVPMSAALAAAIVRNRPAIGSRHTYSVAVSSGTKRWTNVHAATVTAHEPDGVVVIDTDHPATIRARWPEWWQDGTMKEAV